MPPSRWATKPIHKLSACDWSPSASQGSRRQPAWNLTHGTLTNTLTDWTASTNGPTMVEAAVLECELDHTVGPARIIFFTANVADTGANVSCGSIASFTYAQPVRSTPRLGIRAQILLFRKSFPGLHTLH